MGGQGYFFANDYRHGNELWRSNGTSAGTQLVKDINPTGSTNAGLYPDPLMISAGDLLYFFVRDIRQENDLWRTDGSTAGTQPVKLKDGSIVHGELYGATAFQDRLYYFRKATIGWDLWKTDGSPSGTLKIGNLPASANGTELHGKLYFLISPSSSEQQLWVTNGSTDGTKLVKSLEWSSTIQSLRSDLMRIGDRLYFLGWDANGVQPWETDGTKAGTRPCSSEINGGDLSITGSSGSLYILANDEPGYSLWTNRGAAEGSLTLLRSQFVEPRGI